MRAVSQSVPEIDPLDRLRTELADLAYDLERQRRIDAADVVMMIHARVDEMAAGRLAAEDSAAADRIPFSLPA